MVKFGFRSIFTIYQEMKEDPEENLLDLKGRGLKKLVKALPEQAQSIKTLILDENEFQRWDNIDSFSACECLSLKNNQLLRLLGVSRLHNLTTLDVSKNSILTIEGLKDLVHLKVLRLACNKIKAIEHLNTNINLEVLDLSENIITHVSDLSFLKNLMELYLQGNRITQLRQGERHIPSSLVKLSLSNNNLGDLNEISHLVHLNALIEFSISGNPCVNMTGSCIGFDYRPFVINWLLNLKIIDGYAVDDIESLKAEWLYSQGRGRQFRLGEHQALSQYLATVCPLTADSLQTEEDRKLRLILSKAQQHQQQLREQLTNGEVRNRASSLNRSMSSPEPSPISKRKGHSKSPLSRISGSNKILNSNSPDRMASSCHIMMASNDSDASMLMTRSLDPTLLFNSGEELPNGNVGGELECEDMENSGYTIGSSCPLKTATKLVPVPESLMSPEYRPANTVIPRPVRPKSSGFTNMNGIHRPKAIAKKGSPKLARSVHSSPQAQHKQRDKLVRPNVSSPIRKRNQRSETTISSDEDSEMSASKLETIKHRAHQKWQKKDNQGSAEKAAVCIQRIWRGYHTRNMNKKVQNVYQDILVSRTQDYIQKLSTDMEATRAALESERKLQLLQMQAINVIWKKVVSLQPEVPEDSTHLGQINNPDLVQQLTEICSRLNLQVEQLQSSVESIMERMTEFCPVSRSSGATATQTDIIAVHTPQGEACKFPYNCRVSSPSSTTRSRPSSLPIPQRCSTPQEVAQFATDLVDDVLQTVAEKASSEENQVNFDEDSGRDCESCSSTQETNCDVNSQVLSPEDVVSSPKECSTPNNNNHPCVVDES